MAISWCFKCDELMDWRYITIIIIVEVAGLWFYGGEDRGSRIGVEAVFKYLMLLIHGGLLKIFYLFFNIIVKSNIFLIFNIIVI